MANENQGVPQQQAVALRLGQVMEENLLPPRSRTSALADILGISFSAARRKVLGEATFDLDQLEKVAEHFSVPLSRLIGDEERIVPASPFEGTAMPGTFAVAGRIDPCTFWLGDVLALNGPRPPYIAVELPNGQWRVLAPEEAPQQRHYMVYGLMLKFPTCRPTSVAVVDDDGMFCEALAEHMVDVGIDAVAFASGSEFVRTLEHRKFDGFVVDWNMGDTSGEALMRTIRGTPGHARAPIILLTGMAVDSPDGGNGEFDQLSDAVRSQNAVYMRKPTRNELITSSLQAMLQGSATN